MTQVDDEKIKAVVSLLPSATELIDIVIQEETRSAGKCNVKLIGRSHECDWPEYYGNLPMLTASKIKSTNSADIDQQVREQLAAGNGLYSVDKELLASLKPDVVVTQSLCRVCSVDYCLVEKLTAGMDPQPKLVDSNPTSLKEVLRDVERVGSALGLDSAAKSAVDKLGQRITAAGDAAKRLKAKSGDGNKEPPKVGFLEWTDPLFCGGHWTPELIEMAGAKHPLNPCKAPGEGAGPSYTVPIEKFIEMDPDVIVIACCGFDIPRTKQEMKTLVEKPWFWELRAVKENKVWVVDGNQMFNRPGPRLVDALEWLVSMLYDAPELCPPGFPVERWEG